VSRSRRSRSRRRYYNDDNYERGGSRGRKSNRESRLELMTWASLVVVIALGALTRENNITLPGWLVPFLGAVILLGSGVYQYSRSYRVSPITWLAGLVLFVFVAYHFYVDSTQEFVGASLIVFFLVIVFGIITGDT
jgi:hypothetical protein